MVKYENGKIYKLLLPDGHYYIGSTCNELKVRKKQHKDKMMEKGSENRKLYIECKKHQWSDIKIVIYENFPCVSKSELLLRESQIIREHREDFCLNSLINTNQDDSCRLHKKFIDSKRDKEKRSIQMRRYYAENKEKILKKAKEYREINNEKIKECQKEKMICDCGVAITKAWYKKHIDTKVHLKWINENK